MKYMKYMTRDAQETVNLLRGPVTRARAKRMEEEYKEMEELFENMLENFTWHTLEERGEEFKGSKTSLLFKVKMKESKEANLEVL